MNIPSQYSGLIPWGYYLIQGNLKEVPEFAGCQCKGVLPDYDSIPQANRNFLPESLCEKWNIDVPIAQQIYEQNHKLFYDGKIIFFNPRYIELSDVRKLKHNFFSTRNDVSIVGVGFSNLDLKRSPLYLDLAPLQDGGEFLGFDLYGFVCSNREPNFSRSDCSIGCPFRHSDIDNEIPEKLNIVPSSFGLYPDLESAKLAADYINRNMLGEPEYYYVPFGIVKYENKRINNCNGQKDEDSLWND